MTLLIRAAFLLGIFSFLCTFYLSVSVGVCSALLGAAFSLKHWKRKRAKAALLFNAVVLLAEAAVLVYLFRSSTPID